MKMNKKLKSFIEETCNEVYDNRTLCEYQQNADYITFQQKGMSDEDIISFHNGIKFLTGYFSTKMSVKQTINCIDDILNRFNMAARNLLSNIDDGLNLTLPIKPNTTDSKDVIACRIIMDMIHTLNQKPQLIIRYMD